VLGRLFFPAKGFQMQTAMVEPEADMSTGTSLVPLDTLAATIKARVEKGDKASNDAEGHYLAAGLHLVEAKKRLPIEAPGKTFSAYLTGQCKLQTSRAYELIAIAEGRTTVAEVQANGRERAARHAAKNKAARSSVSNGQCASLDPLSEQRNIVTSIMRDFDLPKTTLLAKYATWLADLSEESTGAETELADLRVKVAESEARVRKSNAASIAPPRKLSPASLKARRKSMADHKLYESYSKQFGGFAAIALDRDVLRRMEASLKSGVDDFAGLKQERLEAEQEYIREETQRREELNALLLAPITPEKAEAYARMITTRTLYEGACDLSWAEYFQYREEHPDLPPLTSDDLDYAGMRTACALHPETSGSATLH
jgi:hypothetical protein